MKRLALLLLVTSGGVTMASGRQFAGHFEVTSYCSCPLCCGPHARGITASGRPAAWGVVAADWAKLPEGTRIELSCFPGRVFTVLDTGSAIKGRRLDVWQADHETAREFGRHRQVKVWILDARQAAGRSLPSALAARARSSPHVRTRRPASGLAALQ